MDASVAEFARITTGVLVANLLTVSFVWAMWNLSRLDQAARDNQPVVGRGLYLGVVLMVFGIGLGGLFWVYH